MNPSSAWSISVRYGDTFTRASLPLQGSPRRSVCFWVQSLAVPLLIDGSGLMPGCATPPFSPGIILFPFITIALLPVLVPPGALAGAPHRIRDIRTGRSWELTLYCRLRSAAERRVPLRFPT